MEPFGKRPPPRGRSSSCWRGRPAPVLSRRGGDLDRALGRRALRGLDADCPGAEPCRREGLGPAPPRRVALRRGGVLRQGRAVADVATPETDRGAAWSRPRSTRCASWPTSPAAPPRLAPPQPSSGSLRARPALSALQRRIPDCEASSCPPSPTPRPGPASRPGRARSPPTVRHPGTSASVTPSRSSSAPRRRALGAGPRRQPVLRGRPRALGRPARRGGRDDASWPGTSSAAA